MRHLITTLLIILTLNSYCQIDDTLSYYEEICFFREWDGKLDKPVKFNRDIKIYVSGSPNDTLINELEDIIEELNWLITPINIYIVDEKEISNVNIYFGGVKDYLKQLKCNKQELKYKKSRLKQNWGMFWVTHDDGNIEYSEIFIDIYRTSTNNERMHLLREELTQSLGFPNDSKKYPNSIFYSKWYEDTVEYSNIDKAIIKLHYSSNN